MLVFSLLTASVWAIPEELEDSVPEEAEPYLEDFNDGEGLSWLEKIVQTLTRTAGESMRESVSKAMPCFLIVAFCGCLSWISEEKELPSFLETIGVLGILILTANEVNSFLTQAKNLLEELNHFSRILLPTLTATQSALALGSETIRYAISMTFSDILISCCRNLIFPLIPCGIILAASGIAFDCKIPLSLAKAAKWLCVILLTGICGLFSTAIGITNLAGNATAQGSKAAKTVLSSLIPVAGSALSEVSSAVSGGIQALRSSVGLFGIAAVCAACAVPFFALSIRFLTFLVLSKLSISIWNTKTASFFSALSSAYGILLGIVGTCSVMLFLAIASMMKVVTGA